ncbi:MAG: hypothetical protein JW941_12295 [Candidatus Coatesbacteria bacterium]|nr:hypothetical protein [Candidatus Coatesbacteria bacterium]
MTFDNLLRRGSALAGSLLFLFLVALIQTGCEGDGDPHQDAYDSLKACVNSYWQARVDGRAWQDTETCCASIPNAGPKGKESTDRQDPVDAQVSVIRFEIRELEIKRDLVRAEVKVWLEYTIPLIPTTLTNVINERWERRDSVWWRVPSNLNALLIGAGRPS